ncbi:MAG: hypothetical protein ACR2G2_01520 [Pseudonocardia sp.]
MDGSSDAQNVAGLVRTETLVLVDRRADVDRSPESRWVPRLAA